MTMTAGHMAELAVAVVILGLGVWLYRARKQADEGYGSQGAVILLVIGAIVAIHALGLLKYRPSKAEAELMQERAR
jgi:hypothetical protein